MKNLLMPITASIWYFVTYFLLMGITALMPLVFSLNWILLILAFGIITLVVNLFSSLSGWLYIGIMFLYGNSWVSVVVHSIFGILAVFRFNIITLPYIGLDETKILEYMWNKSIVKTIFIVPLFIYSAFSVIYIMAILPIRSKLKAEKYIKISESYNNEK